MTFKVEWHQGSGSRLTTATEVSVVFVQQGAASLVFLADKEADFDAASFLRTKVDLHQEVLHVHDYYHELRNATKSIAPHRGNTLVAGLASPYVHYPRAGKFTYHDLCNLFGGRPPPEVAIPLGGDVNIYQ